MRENGGVKSKAAGLRRLWQGQRQSAGGHVCACLEPNLGVVARSPHGLRVQEDGATPMAHAHFNAEGDVEFRSILYVPDKAPFDFYDNYYQRKSPVRLYVRRVFISDSFDDLLPRYLSFLLGLVDSDTLPLNVSREMLQQHSSLKTIKKKLVCGPAHIAWHELLGWSECVIQFASRAHTFAGIRCRVCGMTPLPWPWGFACRPLNVFGRGNVAQALRHVCQRTAHWLLHRFRAAVTRAGCCRSERRWI